MLIFRQNRRMIAICLCLGLFRRWKTSALRFARILEFDESLNVETSQTGEKWRLKFTISAYDCDFHVSELVSTLEIAWTTLRTHNAVKAAFKRRNITNGRETTLIFRHNLRMIAICVCLGLHRCWKTRVPRRACKDEWKERLNVEISQTGEK